jgi:UDP-N-acetylglucosamine 2-epimerase (non-hydrolysing)
MSNAPLYGVPTLTPSMAAPGTGALHLAVSRSAATRLAPVRSAPAGLEFAHALFEPSWPPTAAGSDEPPHVTGAAARPEDVDAALEAVLSRTRPAVVLSAGDGDQAVAAALVAARHGIPIARVGAGLRSGDRGAKDEINRLVLDNLADRLYVDGDGSAELLRAEGVDEQRIVRVGSTLADSLARWLTAATARRAWAELRVSPHRYVLVALHTPRNVGDHARLAEALSKLARRTRVVACLHPANVAPMRGVAMTGALGYLDFLSLQAGAAAVITDSAGVQEETTLLGVPCFTLARASERTLTLTQGTNTLLGDAPEDIAGVPLGALLGRPVPIPLWDGRAGRRIATDLAEVDWT